jgi:glutathione S-transferase
VRVWRIPYSTNCERVAIAAGIAGVPIEWVEVDAFDRAPVEAVSGQKGVPVAEVDGRIVVGSLAIIAILAPQLWPGDARLRAEVDIFLEWFDRVWQHPLGILFRDDDEGRKARAGARLGASLDQFEALLDRDFLFGELTAADVASYPFLKYAIDENPDDPYPIHDVMRRHLSVDGRPRLAAWLGRMSTLAQ